MNTSVHMYPGDIFRDSQGATPMIEPGRLDAVFVGVGGGSLLAGLAAVLKSLSPQVIITIIIIIIVIVIIIMACLEAHSHDRSVPVCLPLVYLSISVRRK